MPDRATDEISSAVHDELRLSDDSEDDEKAYMASLRKRERTALHYIKLGGLLFSVFTTMSIVTIYLWHLVSPKNLQWMCTEQLAELKGLAITIITGLILSQLTAYFHQKNH